MILAYYQYFFVTIRFFKLYSNNKYGWPLVWLIGGLYYFAYSTIRAELALAFIYLASILLLKKHKLKSIPFYLLAVSMHSSAFLWGVTYFIDTKFVGILAKNKLLLGVLFVFGTIFLNEIIGYLPSYYVQYLDSEYAQGSVRIASMFS